MEGNGRDLIQDTILAFARKDWGKRLIVRTLGRDGRSPD
jgi:hypothetical protein